MLRLYRRGKTSFKDRSRRAALERGCDWLERRSDSSAMTQAHGSVREGLP